MKRTFICAASAVLMAAGCETAETEEVVSEPWPNREVMEVTDSIGTEIGDSSYVFGALGDVCLSEEGDILAMDQAMGHVRVFSPSGEFKTVFSGRGEGPGEVSIPLALAVLENGEVILLDPGDNCYEVFHGQTYNHLRKDALWSNNPPMDPVGLDGNHYVGMKFQLESTEDGLTGTNTLGRFSTGEEDASVVYWRKEFPVNPAEPGTMIRNMLYSAVFTGDRMGRVFYSLMSTDEYLVTACDSTGNELFTITADIPRAARSQEEMDREKVYMEQWISRMGVNVLWEPEPYRYMVKGLGVDSLERLWVQRGTESPPVFDVFDMTGQHLFSAVYPEEGLTWRFHMESTGMLAWEEDPADGIQKVYLLETTSTR
ncbi:MAG: hypothetical protein GF388_03555 [Candidatus Aegiribacteria sp.]|nr:hypothetical protein [Candidatus Aegiribacteria sp.]MBD3294339.1 hypothetical protein [Candidatus Fermentibacteria bacterium]